MFQTSILILTYFFAKKLFPNKRLIWIIAPLILITSLKWIDFTDKIAMDKALTVRVLWATVGLIQIKESRNIGWFNWTLGQTFGLLFKGQVIFLFTLPIALIRFIWDKQLFNAKKYILGILVSSVVALIPVGIWLLLILDKISFSGFKYLTLTQVSQRVSLINNLTLNHLSYYLLAILFVLFPWSLDISGWRNIVASFSNKLNWQFRFISLYILIPLIFFSVFVYYTGYRYFFPVYPILAILIAYGIETQLAQNKTNNLFMIAGVFSIIWCLFFIGLLAGKFYFFHQLPERFCWLTSIKIWPIFFAFFMFIIGVRICLIKPKTVHTLIYLFLSCIIMQIIYFGAWGSASKKMADLAGFSKHISQLQKNAENVFIEKKLWSDINNEWGYYGFLQKPLIPVTSAPTNGWLIKNVQLVDKSCPYYMHYKDFGQLKTRGYIELCRTGS